VAITFVLPPERRRPDTFYLFLTFARFRISIGIRAFRPWKGICCDNFNMWRTMALVPLTLVACLAADVQQIIAHSVKVNQENWKQAPNYAFIERDADSKHGSSKTIKTYRVLMIDGSQYNQLTAVNDQALAPGLQVEEERKLEKEIVHRRNESARERSRRVAKYERERSQDHALLSEMTQGFGYELSGETVLDSHDVWILKASPKPGYVPKNTEAKMLTGMRGMLWIDKATYQWVKVEAEVFRTVSMYGFIAKVGPGTRFVLEQQPVNETLWMPKRLQVNVNATALGFLNESSTEDDTFRNYRLMPQALAAGPHYRD
jgi:hypothetical protein